MRTRTLLFFILITQYSQSQDSVNIKKHIIGSDTLVFLTSLYYPHSPLVSFINLHDDENTSVEAGLNILSRYGGSLLQLQHSGNRRFTFILNSQAWSFDPNRIFTEKGIAGTLEQEGIAVDSAADEVKKIADSILINYVDDKKLVIALHNNSADGLSILSYIKKGAEAANAAKVYINKTMSPHDFMFTTETELYHYLKQKKINVVLQHPIPEDDGSLSVYAGKNKIPYINVEALQGHLDEQIKMLEVLKDIIFRY